MDDDSYMMFEDEYKGYEPVPASTSMQDLHVCHLNVLSAKEGRIGRDETSHCKSEGRRHASWQQCVHVKA